MKRYIAWTSLLLALSLLTGCQQRESDLSQISLPPASLSVLEDPSSSAQQDPSEGLPDPATTPAEELIEPALEVYSWFALGSMPLSGETKTATNPTTGTEEQFQRVDNPHFGCYQEMEDYLKTFFSDEIVGNLLEEYPFCQDIDGQLYMIPVGRGSNLSIKDVTFSTEEVSESQARLSACVSFDPDLSEEESPKNYEFICQKVDGKWVFTTFPYYL